MTGKTPLRSTRHHRRAASPAQLAALLRELGINPPGQPSFELESVWAAKHVWRVDVNGQPWAFMRYLLGPADLYPNQYRPMRLAPLLNQARVGPRVLGLTPHSQALNGRAALVEAALLPLDQAELETRAEEALALITRLHISPDLNEELSVDRAEVDEEGLRPVAELFEETYERWLGAVAERWREADLVGLKDALAVVERLLSDLAVIEADAESVEVVVPCHNDLNHGNFKLNRNGALRLIDFEQLSLNNPVADLGIFLTWYIDPSRRHDLLAGYPLAAPDAILERMRVWMPLRYLNFAAHWAARLTRAPDAERWDDAVSRIDEWLRRACELVYGHVPPSLDSRLARLRRKLTRRRPLRQRKTGA
jgi:thiamine kinase-like enzyme